MLTETTSTGEPVATELTTAPALVLPAFSGPLDLLLHLIQKNKVSIYDIPIADICDQYHAHLQALEEPDLELAGDFLWMASWLLHLKSRMLLPRPEEEGEDPRQELVERLLEYRRVKELAAVLHEKEVVRRALWQVTVPVAAGSEEVELDWEDVDLRRLAQTYLDVMRRCEMANPPPLELPPLKYKVGETMRWLYAAVLSEGVFPLLRHLHTRPDPEQVVVLVVATLELARLGGISSQQRRPFAEIYLRPGPRELGDDALLQPGDSHGA